jgi:predicted secreted protein
MKREANKMKNLLHIFVVFAIIFLFISITTGCAINSIHRTGCIPSHKGLPQLLSLKVGEIYTIDLEENSTTGYKWHCNIANPSIVSIESEKFIPPSGNQIGVPGKHVWIIKGLKPGITEITFKYYRDQEPENMGEVIVYTVFVD